MYKSCLNGRFSRKVFYCLLVLFNNVNLLEVLFHTCCYSGIGKVNDFHATFKMLLSN